MKRSSRKQVDILTNCSAMVIFANIREFEGREHFRSLVSLSPAMLHHPSSSENFILQLKCNKKQKGPKGLFVDDTIEESNYGQPKGLSSFYERRNHSDTILNSTTSYPIKSNITTHKKKGEL